MTTTWAKLEAVRDRIATTKDLLERLYAEERRLISLYADELAK